MHRLLQLVGSVAAVLLATTTSVTAGDSRCFPEDFLFGSATASYQVEGAVKEGGRTPSIWDQFCRERPEVKCANVADDFYHRYKDDIQLMAKTGLQSFRFSISWSRVMNWDSALHGMRPNPEGIAFYHSLIDELNKNNIKPILTLYHWDLPLELHTELSPQGWLNSDIVQHFAEYAMLMFHEYGSKVNLWTTFNEPLSFTTAGYATGREAPGLTGSPTQVYAATHNVLLSHARAVQLFRELKKSHVISEKAQVAIVLNADYAYPLDESNPADVEAASRKMEFDVGWFLSPIVSGDYPSVMREIVGDRLPRFSRDETALLKGSYDLFMLNHYSTRAATDCDSSASQTDCNKLAIGWQRDRGVDISQTVPGTRPRSEKALKDSHCASFTAYPPGYLETIKWLHKHDTSADILLTENGWCGDDEIDNPDQLWYFQAYLEQVHKAITEEHIPVIGYTAWSFLDNYEWGSYESRFGLYYVNYTSESGSPDFYEPKPSDLARIPRPSAKWFQKVASSKCLNVDESSATTVETPESAGHSHHVWRWLFSIVAIAAVGFAVVVVLVFFVGRRIWRHFRGHDGAATEGTPLL
ncbi:Glycosyl hydrolase family 1 [Phytophthora infestans]|uniref:Glycosyl hydrolase family 1 n=1 Tax=Phytophthora infestans TaxID=4787 RepID=A0A833T533_PHYIN|nr:Glycosyl hydrolase family 1 [Phytophthora infestans]